MCVHWLNTAFQSHGAVPRLTLINLTTRSACDIDLECHEAKLDHDSGKVYRNIDNIIRGRYLILAAVILSPGPDVLVKESAIQLMRLSRKCMEYVESSVIG